MELQYIILLIIHLFCVVYILVMLKIIRILHKSQKYNLLNRARRSNCLQSWVGHLPEFLVHDT